MRALAVVVVGSFLLLSAPASRADAPTSVRNPNLYGETGLVRATSARTGSSEVMLAGHGFGFYSPDFVVPGFTDANTFLGGHTAGSLALFEVVQLSVAAHAAANVNNVAGMQASVGDLITSIKAGYRFLPVAFAVDVRATLPTRVREAGFAFSNAGIGGQGIFTLDLKENIEVPLRVHLNGGYTFQLGKLALADQQFFEQNPNFLEGASGQLLALPTQQWFYDTAHGTLAIEAPLPYVTPFVEATYITALGVPAERGLAGAAYSPVTDAHIIITPGVRITPGAGFAIDLGADIGLTGNGGGLAVDVAQLVAGQPVNPLWLARVGVSHAFDPFSASSASGATAAAAGPTGQLTGCVTDEAGIPLPGAVIEGPALHGARLAADAKGCFTSPPLAAGKAELSVSAPGLESSAVVTEVKDSAVTEVTVKLVGRAPSATSAPVGNGGGGVAKIAGYVTNKEDEVVEAEVDVVDAGGARVSAKTNGGAFSLEAAAGRVYLAARSDKYLASGIELFAENAGARATLVLKPLPKKRVAALEKDKIALSGRIPFDFKAPRMQSAAEFALDEVVDLLLRNPNVRVRVDVFAEGLDTPEAGQALADERARVVAEYLAQHGVARRRIEVKGTAGVDEKSRRVEFAIIP